MRVKISDFLIEKKPLVKKLVEKLDHKYEYVSILGTDTTGKSYGVNSKGVEISDPMICERGFVLRVHNGINYSEFSFNELEEENIDSFVQRIDKQFRSTSALSKIPYDVIKEETLTKSFNSEVEILPGEISPKDVISELTSIKEDAEKYSDNLATFRVAYSYTNVSKIFISKDKDLSQAFISSEASTMAMVRRDDMSKYDYSTLAGLKGYEIVQGLKTEYKKVIDTATELLDAEGLEPGEYDVICTPNISGLIAHEAFGHGVEMDMFLKNRAKGAEYIDKEVASALTTMHDGAAAAVHAGSYGFDDEGTLATDTVVIENGTLRTGISDILSSMKLGTKPSGNGRRQSFERKAYARMTNTFFKPGNDELDDMIASIKHGYLVDKTMSGMEDPKNWGIQCIALIGREIKDGKLTGKIVSPVMMTGYVPEVLGSISMVSKDFKLHGGGFCGKGYKEYVKVSDGGPYLKAKVRLG